MNTDESVRNILIEWNKSKTKLAECFIKRDTEKALPLMESAIELFREFLFSSNGLEAVESLTYEECYIKPVNVNDRLNFISSRPRLYHSYIQLSELFAEQEKQYARQLALKNAKNKRPD